ncbi:unnamed protein product [Leptosia nina]|uniref:Uncharacterized protein n=1 Tax=Leptosia nina TaxID=320188 RepID=A0AAV1JE92_9NEOP
MAHQKSRSSTGFSNDLNSLELCRICNKVVGNIAIFSSRNCFNIANEIKKVSGIIIAKSDKHSKHICHKCLNLLQSCILFRDYCQKSEQRCKEVLNRNENSNSVNNRATILINKSSSLNNETSLTISEENVVLWLCPICNAEFIDRDAYTSHLSTCESENFTSMKGKKKKRKPVKCKICGKMTMNVTTHRYTHQTIFPYHCDICPYKGKSVYLLRVHKISHLKNKPFKCHQCPKATSTSSNLQRHIRMVHSKTLPFKCPYCRKEFSKKLLMIEHVRCEHL